MKTDGSTRRMKMPAISSNYVKEQLARAQALLWSGSLDEVDAAHNMITNLINDLQDQQKFVRA
jgi:hypothetical protein